MKDQIQTPYFLINESTLLNNIQEFQKALDSLWPNSIIAYSVKTNALPWLLNWMNNHGVYAEVVSDEEYQIAELAGYQGKMIVSNGPIKTEGFITRALTNGSIINIDSIYELEYIKRNRPHFTGNIGIRINIDPGVFDVSDIGYQEDGFRFGFCEENGELEKAIAVIRNCCGDIPIGLHMHVNSITRSVGVYKAIAKYGVSIIKKYHLELPFVDIGGGFFGGVPGKATPMDYISAIKEELISAVDPDRTKIIIEPGSAIIGSAVELHTTVTDVKDTTHARIVTTDGSRIYIDPLWKKKKYMYRTTSEKKEHYKQIICGYTCMDHDRLMILENQPELSVGDKITYYRVGNYTVTFGGPFIKPYPPVYVENESGIHLIRKYMTVSDYFKMETL